MSSQRHRGRRATDDRRPVVDGASWRRRIEDQRLARRHRGGDARARATLIERHLPLARSLARTFSGSPEEMDDLLQIASLGLVKAVDRWDPTRGSAFSTFAVPTILGELRHHLRDRTWCVRPPRELQELSAAIEAARDELRAATGAEPTIAALARRLGRSSGDVGEAILASRGRTANPLDPVPEDADVLWQEDAGFRRAEARATLAPLVGDLDDRTRTVLHLRFDRDLVQADIAAAIGCSQFHVSRILATSIEALHQQALGPASAAVVH